MTRSRVVLLIVSYAYTAVYAQPSEEEEIQHAVPHFACTSVCGRYAPCDVSAQMSRMRPYDVLCVNPLGGDTDFETLGRLPELRVWAPGASGNASGPGTEVVPGEVADVRGDLSGGPYVCGSHHDLRHIEVKQPTARVPHIIIQSMCADVPAVLNASDWQVGHAAMSDQGAPCSVLLVAADDIRLYNLVLDSYACMSVFVSNPGRSSVVRAVAASPEDDKRSVLLYNMTLRGGSAGVTWGSTDFATHSVDIGLSVLSRTRMEDMRAAFAGAWNYRGVLLIDADTCEFSRSHGQSYTMAHLPSADSEADFTAVLFVTNRTREQHEADPLAVPAVRNLRAAMLAGGGWGPQNAYLISHARSVLFGQSPYHNTSVQPDTRSCADNATRTGIIWGAVVSIIIVVIVGGLVGSAMLHHGDQYDSKHVHSRVRNLSEQAARKADKKDDIRRGLRMRRNASGRTDGQL